MEQAQKKAWLLLEDGTLLEGLSAGAEGEAVGEVVFNTQVVGYQQLLTDPCYYGQLVVQTFPLIGNYGVNEEDNASENCWVKGYIIREWCEQPSNFRSKGGIWDYLEQNQVVGICDIDTRALTRRLRIHGTMNGLITTADPRPDMAEQLERLKGYQVKGAVAECCSKEKKVFTPETVKRSAVLYDFGYTKELLQALLDRGCKVTVVPGSLPAAEVLAENPDCVILSPGGGNPADCASLAAEIRKLAEAKLPVLGLGLGHQLLAMAHGCKTEKMNHGHRGSNQPVTDLRTGKTFITAQNHGYAVTSQSVDEGVAEITHVNANDHSCEGLVYKDFPGVSYQFAPDTAEGSLVTENLYTGFFEMADAVKK